MMLERWCETAAAVVQGYRRKMRPVDVAIHAIRCADQFPKDHVINSDDHSSAARMSAGEFDDYIRLLPGEVRNG